MVQGIAGKYLSLANGEIVDGCDKCFQIVLLLVIMLLQLQSPVGDKKGM